MNRKGRKSGVEETKVGYRQNRVFRRIEKDLKDKKRRSKSQPTATKFRGEESYIDKDRAIAVGIGKQT